MLSREMGKEFGSIRYIQSKLVYHKGNLVTESQMGFERFFTTKVISKCHKNEN